MYSIEDLKEHLAAKHNISVDQNQEKDLRNIGYYHGYKGYRFVRKANNPINFTNFSQVVALNNFDMQLKGLFYPNLMFIENALKNYVLDATLSDSQSEKLQDIYNRTLTYYKEFKAGTPAYKKEFKKKMDLEMKINSALIRDYMAGKGIEIHFYESGREIPIWAVFESLTLGEFGTFFACSNKNVKKIVSHNLNLPTNLNNDGVLLKNIIFTLKDLRNAIAHNGIIFDTRFSTSDDKTRKNIELALESELKITKIDSNYIVSYIALICYILTKLGENRRCNSFINEYQKLQNMIKNIPATTDMIFGTQDKTVIEAVKNYIKH